jgi:hypothetical protein
MLDSLAPEGAGTLPCGSHGAPELPRRHVEQPTLSLGCDHRVPLDGGRMGSSDTNRAAALHDILVLERAATAAGGPPWRATSHPRI